MMDSNAMDSNTRLVASLQGLTSDSREVCAGGLFAALCGGKFDGRDYIADALARGAKAVLVQAGSAKPARLPPETLWLEAREPRRKFAELASLYHAGKPEQIVAVTGTNGKTSSVIFLQQLWHAAGLSCASLGTLGLGRDGSDALAVANLLNLTTPDPISLHKLLAQLASDGVTHCAVEASSHGLVQHRLDGLRFNAAILTNLSQDHLDYHKTWQNYRAAKRRLFGELLAENAIVVLPLDEPFAQEIIGALGKQPVDLLTTHVGEKDNARASVSAFGLRIDEDRGLTSFSLRFARKGFCDSLGDYLSNSLGKGGVKEAQGGDLLFERLEVPFVEQFQLNNLLGAIAVFAALAKRGVRGADDSLSVDFPSTLANLKGVRGRMECFAHPSKARARIFVDFAHTPQALEFVLREGRRLLARIGGKGVGDKPSEGRLLCVFGCGGDREREKRPLMGAVAAKLADRLYITDDNPRSENAAAIRKEILQPIIDLQEAPYFYEADDRKVAIEQAIGDMREGDVLIIAGKGHESGQIVGEVVRPFDDASVVRAALVASEKTGTVN